MIVSALIAVGLLLLGGLLGLFPAFSLPASVSAFGSELGSAVATANGIFPVVDLGICLGAVLAVLLFLAAWDLVVWVYDKIPFKMT